MLSYLFPGTKKSGDVENEITELAMREALDQHGQFAQNEDGTLTFEDYLTFRSIIWRQGCREFQKHFKEGLRTRSLEAFNEKNQEKYVSIFHEGQSKFNNCIITMVRKGCDWIELGYENYMMSQEKYFNDPDKIQEIISQEVETRLALDRREITEDISIFIKASKFKFQRDMDMHRKLRLVMQNMDESQRTEYSQIEMSKTSDALYLEFGFDLNYLMTAVEHFKLLENEEIINFQKIVMAQKESEDRQVFEKASPPIELLYQMLAESEGLGKAEFKQDETLTFDYYLQSSKLALKYTYNFTKDGLDKHAQERRIAVKEKDIEKCQKLILETANWEQLTTQIIQANLYQHLKVPKPVFEKSMQVYMMDPEKRAIYEDEIQKLRDSLRSRIPQELTREQCIDSIKFMEKAKFEAQTKMYEMVRSQRIPPQMINAIIKVEKLKCDDEFFNSTGIEEEDVEPSIKRLGLEEDPEMKAIVEEWEAKSKEFLESKKDETAKLMAAAAEYKARMEAESKEALAQKEEENKTHE